MSLERLLTRVSIPLCVVALVALSPSCSSEDDGSPNAGGAGGTSGSSGGSTSTSSSTSTSTSSSGSSSSGTPDGWLYTEGNRIHTSDGAVWHGRGMNIHDTRSCWACAWQEPDTAEVMRRMDEAVDVWGANYLRLVLENYETQQGAVQWENVLEDPAYLEDVVELVDHVGQKPGVYVLLSLWAEPTTTELQWPTEQTREIWRVLADTFRDDSHVLFGLVNEPESNFDGALDADCWQAMNETVQAIRDVEDEEQSPHHLIAVQGTGAWARRLEYYVDHPITAGGGENVIYEIHVYNPAAEFQDILVTPAQTLPVIIGEYGPADPYMSTQDVTELMTLALDLEIPHAAWTFHHNCAPNLLEAPSGCGIGMDLVPSAWGQQLIDHLAVAW